MSAKHYRREIQKGFGYLGNWLPITPIEVGDVGFLGPNGFQKHKHNLRYFGPSFDTGAGQLPATLKGDISRLSVSSAEMTGKAGTDDFKAAFTFGSQGQFVFQATGCTSTVMQYENLAAIESACLDRLWDEDWIFITEVVHAERVTAFLSDSKKASIHLKGPTGLKDLLGDIKVTAATGEVTSYIGLEGAAIMYRAMRVKRNFWNTRALTKPVTRTGDTTRSTEAPFELEEVVLTADD